MKLGSAVTIAALTITGLQSFSSPVTAGTSVAVASPGGIVVTGTARGGIPATGFQAAAKSAASEPTGVARTAAPAGRQTPPVPGPTGTAPVPATPPASAQVASAPITGATLATGPIGPSPAPHQSTPPTTESSVPTAGTAGAARPGSATPTAVPAVPRKPAGALSFDAPGNVQATQNSQGLTLNATVTWNAPVHTGSHPITGYVLTTVPATTTQSLGALATSANLVNLTRASYTVTIYAVNSADAQSGPGTTTIAISPPCSIRWTGSATGSWNIAANWTPERVPKNTDWVCLPDSGAPAISVDADSSVAGITHSGSATIAVVASTSLAIGDYVDAVTPFDGPGAVVLSAPVDFTMDGISLSSTVHLINQGHLTVVNTVNMYGTAVLENSGTLTLGSDADPGVISDQSGGTARVINTSAGSIAYPGGGHGALIDVPITNRNTITDAGTGTGADNLVITALTPDGDGTYIGPITVGTLDTSNGASIDAQNLTINTAITGAGDISTTADSIVTIDNGTNPFVTFNDTAELDNHGQLNILGNLYMYDDAALVNYAVLTLGGSADPAVVSDQSGTTAVLVNIPGATIIYPGGGHGARIGVPFINVGTITNSGTGTGSDTLTLTLVLPILTSTYLGPIRVGTISTSLLGNNSIMKNASARHALHAIHPHTPQSGAVINAQDMTIFTGISGTGSGAVTLSTESTVAIDDTADPFFTYNHTAHLINLGHLAIGHTVYMYDTAILENSGTVIFGGTAAAVISDQAGGTTSIVNDGGGSITYPGGGQGATTDVPVTNYGAVNANGAGTLEIDTLTNLSPTGMLTAGTYRASGTLKLAGAIGRNSAVLAVLGAGRIIDSSDQSALATLSSNTGLLLLSGKLTSANSITNSGAITIVSGGALAAPGFWQTAGSTTVGASGTLTAGVSGTGTFRITGGVFKGTGQVLATVNQSNGSLATGGGVTPLAVSNLALTPAVTWRTNITPLAAQTSASVAVSGTASIDGTLALATQPGYLPPVGTQVDLLTALGGVTGTYAAVTGAALSGRHWVVERSSTTVSLVMTSDSGPCGARPATGSTPARC